MLQIMVFDKTGTLTEDGLEIIGTRGLAGSTLDGLAPLFFKFVDRVSSLIPHINDLSANEVA